MPAVVITVAGVDVTDDVVYASARFKMQVNGQPGDAYMRVRDLGLSYSFDTGSDWLVTIDGDAAWRGFVTGVRRVYIAPAMDVEVPGTQRFIDLTGVDINILFQRRIVSNHSDRANVAGTLFPAGTYDDEAITELLDWLDLGDDDLDTTSGVNQVGQIDPDQKTRAWAGSWTWAQAMDTIAMVPAAIYYLRPETGSPKATLVYCDVDEVSAPFGLSDQPDGTTTRGYREMEISLDASSMANDVLAWGMGYGSQSPVFKRMRSQPSIDQHGLWQTGKLALAVYKQGTINRIADSILNGSPESRRGAKDDKPSVALVTYEPGLLAGHVVNFSSEIWGWSDAIPIRQSLLLFEAPDVPRWELVLSHEIDAPWGFIDQFWPKYDVPGWCITNDCTPPPSPVVGECDGLPPVDPADEATTIDDFDRTAGSWGTASGGLTWTPNAGTGSVSYSTDGSHGVAVSDPDSLNEQTLTDFEWTFPLDIMFSDLSVNASVEGGSAEQAGDLVAVMFANLELRLARNTTGDNAYLYVDGVAAGSYAAGTATRDGVNVRLHSLDGLSLDVYLWGSGDAQPATPAITTSRDVADVQSLSIRFVSYATLGRTVTGKVGWIGYGPTSTPAFDDFQRTETGSWGTATPGGTVWTLTTSGATTEDVLVGDIGAPYGYAGYIGVGPVVGGETTGSVATPALPFFGLPEWTIEASFTFGANGGSAAIPTSVFEVTTPTGEISLTLGASYLTIGGVSTGTPSVGFSWDVTDTYLMKMHYLAESVAEAKVWVEGATEPDWQVYGVPDEATTATSVLRIGDVSTVGISSLIASVSYMTLAFSYLGSPCYYDCGPSGSEDDFTRTVVTGWGTATPGGHAWLVYGLLPFSEVSGTYGVLAGTTLDVTTTATAELVYDLPVGTVFRVLWNAVAGGTPQVLFVSDVDLTGSTNAWYWTEVLIESDGYQWKTWPDGGSEPPSYTDSTTAAPSSRLTITFINDTGGDAELRVSEVDLWNQCLPILPGASGAPSSPSGFGCETAIRESPTAYSILGSFVTTSTFVFVDGLLYQRDVLYSEDSSGSGVTFTNPVTPSAVVTICYVGQEAATG